MNKMLKLTAVIEREGDGYVSTCPEFDIVSQGEMVEEARLNLVEVGRVIARRRLTKQSLRREARLLRRSGLPRNSPGEILH